MEKYIDHTALKAVTTKTEIDKLIAEAKTYGFKSVCVNPSWVKYCVKELKNSEILVCTVIGFPLGANTKEVKAFEASQAIKEGALEIDMVINIGKAKENDFEAVYQDILAVRNASLGVTLKVILETCYLTKEEIKECSKRALKAKADFIKTSTGFGTGGATIEDVKIMKEIAGTKMEVKASGGVRSKEDMLSMLSAGATRIGTSNSVEIVIGQKSNNDY
ncbi:MAG: deoxyribose-phosphate aldolase [Erysipelotrichales bacterium]|nr:deoxyribose-phosphate aldolase [Erysipelotrichales bacterium]